MLTLPQEIVLREVMKRLKYDDCMALTSACSALWQLRGQWRYGRFLYVRFAAWNASIPWVRRAEFDGRPMCSVNLPNAETILVSHTDSMRSRWRCEGSRWIIVGSSYRIWTPVVTKIIAYGIAHIDPPDTVKKLTIRRALKDPQHYYSDASPSASPYTLIGAPQITTLTIPYDVYNIRGAWSGLSTVYASVDDILTLCALGAKPSVVTCIIRNQLDVQVLENVLPPGVSLTIIAYRHIFIERRDIQLHIRVGYGVRALSQIIVMPPNRYASIIMTKHESRQCVNDLDSRYTVIVRQRQTTPPSQSST